MRKYTIDSIFLLTLLYCLSFKKFIVLQDDRFIFHFPLLTRKKIESNLLGTTTKKTLFKIGVEKHSSERIASFIFYLIAFSSTLRERRAPLFCRKGPVGVSQAGSDPPLWYVRLTWVKPVQQFSKHNCGSVCGWRTSLLYNWGVMIYPECERQQPIEL